MQDSSAFRLKAELGHKERQLATLRSQLKKLEQLNLHKQEMLANLIKKEQRLETMHQHSQEVWLIVAGNLVCRYASPSVTRWLGFAPGEMVGHSLNRFIHPEDWPTVEQILQAVAGQIRQSQSLGEYRVCHKDGEWRYFEATATNLMTNPSIGGIIINCREISNRLELEEHLSETQLQLLEYYRRVQQSTVLEERARVARQLHDSLQQELFGIMLKINTSLRLLKDNPARVEPYLYEALSLAEGGMAELRSLIFDLKPDAVATQGLVAGITNYVSTLQTRYQLQVESRLGPEPEVEIKVKEALYAITREALLNTVKHARATEVQINLRVFEGLDYIELTIGDNGRGFDPKSDFSGHYGLSTIREQVETLGGELIIESNRGEGTLIQVILPINPE